MELPPPPDTSHTLVDLKEADEMCEERAMAALGAGQRRKFARWNFLRQIINDRISFEPMWRRQNRERPRPEEMILDPEKE